MKFVTIICVLSQFLTIALSAENYKTVPLCMEKTPKNIRSNWKPNHDEMRELMLKAAILNEGCLIKCEENPRSRRRQPCEGCYQASPNAAE